LENIHNSPQHSGPPPDVNNPSFSEKLSRFAHLRLAIPPAQFLNRHLVNQSVGKPQKTDVSNNERKNIYGGLAITTPH
jgi:hypothetical protein